MKSLLKCILNSIKLFSILKWLCEDSAPKTKLTYVDGGKDQVVCPENHRHVGENPDTLWKNLKYTVVDRKLSHDIA